MPAVCTPDTSGGLPLEYINFVENVDIFIFNVGMPRKRFMQDVLKFAALQRTAGS